MITLALDQSSNCSGWAVFNNNELIGYGKIDLSKKSNLGERLCDLRAFVHNLINEFKVEKVILEDIYLDNQKFNNVQTFKTLAEVFGVLFELCVEIDIPVEAVLAQTWKSALQIKNKTREAQKKEAQDLVLKKYNAAVSQDEADAICIGSYITNFSVNSWDDE